MGLDALDSRMLPVRERPTIGIGYQSEVVTNKQGGKQSDSPYFFRGLPPLALEAIAKLLKEGAQKYEADPFGDISKRNWHNISSKEHLEHVLNHIIQFLKDDTFELHHVNLACRALFFLEMYIREQNNDNRTNG